MQVKVTGLQNITLAFHYHYSHVDIGANFNIGVPLKLLIYDSVETYNRTERGEGQNSSARY